MRTFLTVSALLLASAAAASAQMTNAFKLTGPIKTSRLEVAKVTSRNGASVEGPRVLVELLSFDKHGKSTAQTVNNPDGSTKLKYGWKTSYDAAGRLTRQEFYNARGVQTCVATYEPDERGRIGQATFYCPRDVINHKESYFYDDDGNKIRQLNTNRDGTARMTIVYLHDQGRLLQENHYGADGSLESRNIHVYDDQGNKREFGAFDNDGSILIKVGMTYNADSRGQPAELLTYSRRNILLTKETYTYEFDSHGNWTKRKTIKENFQNATPTTEVEIAYRELTYY